MYRIFISGRGRVCINHNDAQYDNENKDSLRHMTDTPMTFFVLKNRPWRQHNSHVSTSTRSTVDCTMRIRRRQALHVYLALSLTPLAVSFPVSLPSRRGFRIDSQFPKNDILDIPSDFQPLIQAAANATATRGADTSNTGHDSFRYEWGTWVNDDNLKYLMDQINSVRLLRGAYEALMTDNPNNNNTTAAPRRLKVAGGQDWDCLLHVLPQGTEWKGRWPSGSWAMVKTLTGLAELSALTGPDRNGYYKAKTTRDLRGGSDGSIGGGQSSAGDDCIKYVGGPLRRYKGKYGKTSLLEVVIRPPIGKENFCTEAIECLENIENVLSIWIEPEIVPERGESGESTMTDATTQQQQHQHLGVTMGMSFENVGGLDAQLDAIARRVLASRANPSAARRLGVSHVKGILLSGPPGCGKTLMARELARMLGAREPQIVDGPSILDKFIGEAEKKVRELFAPAEMEYKAAGDESALHIIILDEMDAIARKRGTMSCDTTGVRDSVVNQLLAKMDGVKEASNVLIIGLTNRPELLDPALLRPGRLEVQIRIELPDLPGRRDILRIHTRQMKESGSMDQDALNWIEDLGEKGLPARTEHFSGAELAGLVRSAASYALGRTLKSRENDNGGILAKNDLELALGEVLPALGKQDELLKMRYPFGISACSKSMERIMRDLLLFTKPRPLKSVRIESMLVIGAGRNGGAGATALAAWAATGASNNGVTDYVRFITALDLLSGSDGGSEAARAAALVERFSEAREMSHSLLVLDDVDQLCGGSGPGGYSSVMLSTLRALLRSPPPSASFAKAGGQSMTRSSSGEKTIHIIAATSRSDAACSVWHELFDETIGKDSDVPMRTYDTINSPSSNTFLFIKSSRSSPARSQLYKEAIVRCSRAFRIHCEPHRNGRHYHSETRSGGSKNRFAPGGTCNC
jgi:SpoVK/Ycf46/Vps4 family AAA+-type ATPase